MRRNIRPETNLHSGEYLATALTLNLCGGLASEMIFHSGEYLATESQLRATEHPAGGDPSQRRRIRRLDKRHV